jgi:hypothetical protein
MYRGTQFDGLSEGCMPDVTVSKMHACERATPMRYTLVRCSQEYQKCSWEHFCRSQER